MGEQTKRVPVLQSTYISQKGKTEIDRKKDFEAPKLRGGKEAGHSGGIGKGGKEIGCRTLITRLWSIYA